MSDLGLLIGGGVAPVALFRSCRETWGYTQEEAGELLGVSRRTVVSIEDDPEEFRAARTVPRAQLFARIEVLLSGWSELSLMESDSPGTGWQWLDQHPAAAPWGGKVTPWQRLGVRPPEGRLEIARLRLRGFVLLWSLGDKLRRMP